ncbi:hypothetical protein CRUP_006463 [Coryphaenoides rupestris]|nr:hypothetical protein CRUP_006463 [Coryphaenoides rupestris]
MTLRWFRNSPEMQEDVRVVTEELKNLYYKRLMPIEKHSSFSHFHSPSYEDADFDNKPMVLVMGQYSTGKTTFINQTWYDFPAVLRWFAERVDRIILLFDAHKLDFSDELTRAFAAVRGHEDKLRVVLNKADRVDSQQLMRVYGALMWSLGKVFPTPEVLRVYVGSFWSEPRRTCDHYQLLEAEEEDLLADIRNLPRNAAVRKLNDLVKRARLVRAHAHIIGYLKQEMPTIFCKESKKHNLIYQLPVIFTKIQQQHRVPAGDFPDCTKMQERLLGQDFSKFKVFKPSLMASLDKLLSTDIAKLMPLLQKQEPKRKKPPPGVLDGEFLGTFRPEHFQRHPFKERPPGDDEGHEKDAGDAWVVERLKPKYDEIFFSLCPRDGKVSGTKAKEWMVNTHLPSSVLAQVWRLADVDCDGMLDNEEFALAVHLIEGKLEGHWLPRELPPHLVPPSKRPCESEDDEEEDVGSDTPL